ncbi:N-acetylmuramoyl-L-alanine amidase [Thermoactinomyces sp. DSM 45891]|uniref:N-acetylmuramoyl-L-alanine amidase n=1 Tax=Thermoactinomyces sp. DSM 45891 TaxID=1761907 RepID=UPI000916845A|nr:N-acetylmuramoyl-L-alanine amidase [Thermoactinomyces sp. DSM 45891]SFX71848.1 N-acetylmuramoyl-L-alanine amidase [Thermoactinomyces sp. DSM 45891]
MTKLICLDAGHGGKDSGAIGYGLREADVALKLVELVNHYLGSYACVTTLTRNKNTSASYPSGSAGLRKRIAYANNKGADFYLSLHCNAGRGSGFESYVAQPAPTRTKRIQKIINDSVLDFLKGYGVKAHGNPEKVDIQAARGRIAVVRDTKMSAVLLENLFIDNPTENKLLKDGQFLDGLAKAITLGVASALGLDKR